ncbi:peptide chain release factor N(5)-glutamine methyltransferase [Nocardioides yefusunii]|uniref:Release factor glutamine methyltransferase n=1 Tax=Nocardioides yefusunii TaxID=2500546 RepID=A0ABW1QYT5_9ACTN|nr:peptide chain release factor N(5)-glutamine methyltransferase [Nocardioides yefusunii]
MAALNPLRREWETTLSDAGVASPQADVTWLLCHVLDTKPGTLSLREEISSEHAAQVADLVARRATRVPLQHLTGSQAFRMVELEVGPGVFVPRPETELLAGWAIEQLHVAIAAGVESPVVVDLCTGSGAIAKALADEVPQARVHAVELSEDAFAWASLNLAGTGVDLRQGDMALAFDDLLGEVDVVVCNPPYIPLEAWESVALEARDHDPHLALFSGDDGLDAMRVLEARATELLKPAGVLGVEHADVQGESAPAVFVATGRWTEVRDHQDLAGRARFLTARLAR